MQMPQDFPPVPKCFSHLLSLHRISGFGNMEHEDHLSQSLPLSLLTATHEPNNSYCRSLSENSENTLHSPDYYCMNSPFCQDLFAEDQHDHHQSQSIKANGINSAFALSKALRSHKGREKPVLTKQSSVDELTDDEMCQPDMSNPFVKLNSSLDKLQKEMKELRLYDVSLFHQLLSLHESIQDLKFNIGERYSETGSEYSLGSASYMGSMSSLDEESDWGDSQIFTQSLRGEEESAADDDENRQSTSSLLEQITALTQRAEQDI